MAYIKTSTDYQLKTDWPELKLTDDLEAFFDDVLDPKLQEMIASVKAFPGLKDPYTIPSGLLDLYLLSFGFRTATDFPGILLTEREKRKLAVLAVPLYRQKGTRNGIQNIIRLLLGIEIDVITLFNVDGWILDESELDTESVLFVDGDDTYNRYAFEIVLLEAVDAETEAKIEALVEFMKPIHTHLFRIIAPETFDHWELGLSELDEDTYLH